MVERYAWWRTGLADGDHTLAADPGLEAAVAPAAGAVGAGAPGAVPDPVPDLVPVVTRGVVVPAPGQEGSPLKASLVPATASLVPAATNPDHAATNPDPTLVTASQSRVQRAVLR